VVIYFVVSNAVRIGQQAVVTRLEYPDRGSGDNGAKPTKSPAAPAAPTVGRTTAVAWLGSLAAAVVLAVGLSWFLVARPLADAAQDDRETASALVRITTASVALEAQPDVRHVTLAVAHPPSAAGPAGTLSFSPGSREVVVVTTGLATPGPDEEYRCWVEANGRRDQLGRMYEIGDIAAWEGTAEVIASVPAGARFGISLAKAGEPGAGEPVLAGQYGGP
jgi:hypothetical protein